MLAASYDTGSAQLLDLKRECRGRWVEALAGNLDRFRVLWTSREVEFPPLAGHSHSERVLSPTMGLRVGKESCWEGNDGEGSSLMSSNEMMEIVRTSGKPIRQVANELGIYDSTLGNWVRQDEINRGEREGLTTDERERLGELERENARLRTGA